MKKITAVIMLLTTFYASAQEITGLQLNLTNSIDFKQTDLYKTGDDLIASGICRDSLNQPQAWVSLFNAGEVSWSRLFTNELYDYFSATTAYATTLNNSPDIIVTLKGYDPATYSGLSMRVMRLNRQTGDLVWSKTMQLTYDVNFEPSYHEVHETTVNADDEILATYSVIDFMHAVKFNSNGDTLFARKINNVGDNQWINPGFAFIETADGGYIGSFTSDTFPAIVRLDANMEVLWTKRWTLQHDSYPHCILEMANGNFVIAGQLNDKGNFLVLTDPAGNVLNYYRLNMDHKSYKGFYRIGQPDDHTIFLSGDGFYNMIDLNTSGYQTFGVTEHQRFYLSGTNVLTHSALPDSLSVSRFSIVDGFNSSQPICVEGELLTEQLEPSVLLTNPISFYVKRHGTLLTYQPVVLSLDAEVSGGCPLSLEENEAVAYTIYPNPVTAGSVLSIDGLTHFSGMLLLKDVTGNLIRRYAVNPDLEEILLPAVDSGIYFLQFENEAGQLQSAKKLVIE